MNYSQLASTIAYYLWKYPSVEVALECVQEELVEAPVVMKQELLEAIGQIKAGQKDVQVLKTWGRKAVAPDLELLGEKIEEGRKKGLDIGFYVKNFVPVSFRKDDNFAEMKKKTFERDIKVPTGRKSRRH